MAKTPRLQTVAFAILFGVAMTFGPSARAQSKLDSAAAKSRVYLLTATYGIVAGSLTGLGSLAFYDQPSQKTRNIAIGASVGLYVGLLLGAYMIYGVDTSTPGKKSSPSAPPTKGGGKSEVEDPLRLDSSLSEPSWTPYIAYNEKQKVLLAGFQLNY